MVLVVAHKRDDRRQYYRHGYLSLHVPSAGIAPPSSKPAPPPKLLGWWVLDSTMHTRVLALVSECMRPRIRARAPVSAWRELLSTGANAHWEVYVLQCRYDQALKRTRVHALLQAFVRKHVDASE